MPPPARTPWLEAARRITTARAAVELGQLVSKRVAERCPCCSVARPRDGRGRLAASGATGVGLSDDLRGWKCFACSESGDPIDFAALAITGRRLRECTPSERDEVRQFFARITGEAASSSPDGTPSAYIRTGPVRPAPSDHSDVDYDPPPPPSPTPPSSSPAFEPEPEPELLRPPLDQLQRLWRQCTTRVDAADRDDDIRARRTPALEIVAARQVADYLRSKRNLDPTLIADANLAVALVRDDRALGFMRIGRRRWFDMGYGLLLKLYDHHGVARNVLARCARELLPKMPKSTSPQGDGQTFKRSRLCMANALGRQMLQHGTHPSKWPAAVSGDPFPLESAWWPESEPFWLVIAEGELDYLTWATSPAWPESNPFAPAVIGIVEGSWHRCFAERIPLNTRIIISEQTKPDGSPDPAAQKYTAKIRATLEGRDDLTIDIWHAPSDGARDEHDDSEHEGI
jgi:hypothetical protein